MSIELLEDVEVGVKLGPMKVHLDEPLVARYRQAIGVLPPDRNREQYCPPTILETSMAGLTVERFKYRERGAVHIKLHVKTDFRFIRPIPVGTTVTLTGELVDVRVSNDRQYLVIRFQGVDERGERLIEMELHNTFGGGSRGMDRYPAERAIDFEW